MSGKALASAGALVITIAVVSLAPILVAGQTAPASGTTTASRPAKPLAPPKPAKAAWTPPRTPWGDPDLQGSFTNKSEQATPFERPKEFEGRRIEDIQGAELADILRERQERVISNARPPDGGVHAPLHWSDRFDITKGSRPWLVVEPPDGKIPPMTPEGQQRAAARAAATAAARREHGPADSWEDRSLYDRCISRGLPTSMMPTIYGNSYQIVQAQGYVAIRYEMIHETRVIPLDDRPHLGQSIRSYMGDGRGHWEGNSLVVETTNFREETAYRGADPRTLRLIERFTRVAADKVMWAVTVDDPKTWTRAWTFAVPLTLDNGEAVFEYACHEGNYGLRNILSAARAEEKAAAEDAKNGITRVTPRASDGGEDAEK
jgi:hypothetical protein